LKIFLRDEVNELVKKIYREISSIQGTKAGNFHNFMKNKRDNATPSNEHPAHPKRGNVPPEATEIEWCSSHN
jgi:hypothetical protein